jgi:hypothetical protein
MPLGVAWRSWIGLLLSAFAVLLVSITSQPAKQLRDFDQLFYASIAYDLDRYGVFSNGVFTEAGTTAAPPAPGMFFTPVYPALVLAAMKLDRGFAESVKCAVEAQREQRHEAACALDARPIHVLHALLLAFGVLMIAVAGELMFRSRGVFWLAGVLATSALAAEAGLLSFVMTESVAFCLYGVFVLAILIAWSTSRASPFVLVGGLVGALCLTRPSFLVLFPGIVGLILFYNYRHCGAQPSSKGARVFALCLGFAAVLGPWMTRNSVSVGKFALTEEYGSAALIERFAYNDMTAREFVQAFPYCTPGLGDLAFDLNYGTDSMHRFVYHTRDSFFHAGRGRREMLVKEHGRLDPLFAGLLIEELRARWWRHLLVSIPLFWCGMWAGWIVSLVLVPLFGWACADAVRRSQPLLLLYAAPAVVMLGLHAAVANHHTRYNLILIGPFAVAAAWRISEWIPSIGWRLCSRLRATRRVGSLARRAGASASRRRPPSR